MSGSTVGEGLGRGAAPGRLSSEDVHETATTATNTSPVHLNDLIQAIVDPERAPD